MFEDSLFASKVEIRTARARWAAATAVAVQGMLVTGLLVAPMLRPLAMPGMKVAPPAVMVNLRRTEIKTEPVRVKSAANDAALRAPASEAAPMMERRGGGQIAEPVASNEAAPLVAMGLGMGRGIGPALGIGTGAGEPAAPAVQVRANVPVRISSGVSSGMLLAPMRPMYPAIARAAHVEGTVVISARIDRSGRIVGLQVTSGPEMLRSAAVDAVKEARYRPYMLNGEPTEVETTIAVNFRMGG